jgi:cold shock CspA family protein/ribosome-associated translation inhibitor RaiA
MLPLRIAVRNTTLSPETEADLRDRAAALSRYYGRIVGCLVTVDVPHGRRKSQALEYRVRLDITLPGGEIVINRQPRDELRTAVQDAFSAARRRLEDYARRQNGAVKAHEPPPIGRVSQYYPLGGYGFIEAQDGHEVYFDQKSVLDGGFDRLDVGTEVRFNEEPGEKGPQATTVALAAQRHVEQQE